MTRFRWGFATDVGQVRSVNQDDALAIEGLFAVADGMGGHRGGEVASEIAVRVLRESAPLLTSVDLIEAIHAANDTILDRALHDETLRGMGTTLCVVALVDNDGEEQLAIANVGDSRVYLFASGELEQMTDDHSLVAALVREGRITQQEAEDHPQRNILTRALGIDHEVAVDAWEVAPFVGDRWVLCSDGLFNEVSIDQMASVLRRLEDPDAVARELVRLANQSGGHDNITVLVVDIVDAEGHALIDPSGERAGTDDDHDVDQRVTAAAIASDEVDDGAVSSVASTSGDARSRFTWRVGLFIVAMVIVAAVVVGSLIYFGTGESDDEPTPPFISTTTSTTTTSTPTTSTTGPTTTGVPAVEPEQTGAPAAASPG